MFEVLIVLAAIAAIWIGVGIIAAMGGKRVKKRRVWRFAVQVAVAFPALILIVLMRIFNVNRTLTARR